jgi:predicted Rossmann-fold nucleotide-binding protein
METLPFIPIRDGLYTPEELLLRDFTSSSASLKRTPDLRTYQYFVSEGRGEPRSHFASMMESLHDNSMSHACHQYLEEGKRVVGIVGGHDLTRDAPPYAAVASIARSLARGNVLVVSGGGPGAMEAAHLGAALGPASDKALPRALKALRKAAGLPRNLSKLVGADGRFNEAVVRGLHHWWKPVVAIAQELGRNMGESLAFPTWYYGHEPFTPLATHVAKYFQNSLREDGLIAIANAGVLFTEGKAGTLQEIFQDATGNFYAPPGGFRPMVFLGIKYWTSVLPVIPLLSALFKPDDVRRFICVTDSPTEAAAFLLRPAPRRTA